ncbi:MAG: hypothetical protein A2491_06165 [Bacteroidetes bacterium RIFOXYC12_FULL_35_7]|nr:MAG: hypothetical protein A2491_06165 [Bacteroidetes bacterium RIFOXYC12_FULL_35_7]
MGKSLGNFITLDELFNGTHKLLVQAYSPMTIRFFILQAHYRSTLDFSNEALQAAEKGMQRLLNAYASLDKITAADKTTVDMAGLRQKCFDAMSDDLNTPIVIAHLFDSVKTINSVAAGSGSLSKEDIDELRNVFSLFLFDILGLQAETNSSDNSKTLEEVVNLMLNLRMEAKSRKDFETSDKIRNELTKIGFEIKDKKDGFEWTLKV